MCLPGGLAASLKVELTEQMTDRLALRRRGGQLLEIFVAGCTRLLSCHWAACQEDASFCVVGGLRRKECVEPNVRDQHQRQVPLSGESRQ